MTLPRLLPFAQHELIPPGANDPAITAIGNVFHVAVSESPDLHDYFNGPSGGIESHGYIRRDGTVIQYRTLDREADAQGAGNSFAYGGKLCGFLSWETQGGASGQWTPEQVATIKRIMRFTHDEGGIPLHQAPAWNRPGNGYHSLFREWNPNNHSCPGPDRIRQWPTILKEAAVATPAPSAASRWTRVRGQLLAVLNSEDAKNIAASRVAIRAFLAATRAAIKRLPTS